MNIEDLPKDKKIILFDGVCNLCDSSVQYVIIANLYRILNATSRQVEWYQTIL